MISFYEKNVMEDAVDGRIRLRELVPEIAARRKRNRILWIVLICFAGLLSMIDLNAGIKSYLSYGTVSVSAVVVFLLYQLLIGWAVYTLCGREKVALMRSWKKYGADLGDTLVVLDDGDITFTDDEGTTTVRRNADAKIYYTPRFIFWVNEKTCTGWFLRWEDLVEAGVKEEADAFFRKYYQVTVLER